jgi:O-antigen/teichoic acid export membrane protein
MLISQAIGPAIQPLMKGIASDQVVFDKVTTKFIIFLSYVSLFFGVIVHFLSGIIVDIVLGDNWTGVVNILEIFSWSIPFHIMMSITGGFFLALGKSNYLFFYGLFNAVSTISLVIYGLSYESLEIVAWMVVLSSFLTFIYSYYLLYVYTFKKGVFRMFLHSIPVSCVLPIFIFWRLVNV